MFIYKYIFIYVHIHLHIYVCTRLSLLSVWHLHLCVYVCVYTHTFTSYFLALLFLRLFQPGSVSAKKNKLEHKTIK